MFESLKISGSGMTANRLWLDTISNNIANMKSTGRPGSNTAQVYKRQAPVFSQVLKNELDKNPAQFGHKSEGVTVTQILHDNNDPRMVYKPSHPHAGKEGYVAYPNINITTEMANMMAATRAYQANAAVNSSAKQIISAAIQMGRG
ncbi:MAG: flagellar basal body rod protein FlgC [Clostridiales bacterium]|nr:flagellar basal body rod protein FlgC [Clostridiales bacterium]MCF8021724.1 flagellar basal body rod protein FlgC [Clostridiales bacterium]